MSARRRLDAELTRRGLAESRSAAQELLAGGKVLVNGSVAAKAARQVHAGDAIEIVGPAPRFVSRGGLKLDHALDQFAVDVEGRRALDAGASTGGFTDCLVQRGAAEVLALDVGYGQIHEAMRGHPRVRVVERFNVRDLTPDDHGRFDLIVADLSFISLTKVARALLGVARGGADLVLLVKPQFEAGRAEVARGRGIISDPAVWRRTVDDVRQVYESSGAELRGEVESPIHGADGNTEFLVWFAAVAG